MCSCHAQSPSIDVSVGLISAWQKIGVEAEHKLEESATWSQSRVNRNFELLVDPFGSSTVGDPDEMLDKFTSTGQENWGRFKEAVADALYEQQALEMNEEKRIQLVKELQKVVMQTMWYIPGLWWTRAVVRSARIPTTSPSRATDWMNRRLEDVWLAEK